ncbi:unnamed protein product [Arabidopsis lyrata]|nr:unnamed protein product [Arabidopsis lyrata]
MSSPEKKRKKTSTTKKPSLQSIENPSLPDDLLSISPRSFIGCTESCLYVCLLFPPDPNPCWSTLWKKLDRTSTEYIIKKKNKSSEYVLATVPIPHSPPACRSGLVAVGSDIYNMRRHLASRSWIAGGCPNGDLLIEVFDAKTQIWNLVPSPYWDCGMGVYIQLSIKGRFHLMTGREGMAYNPMESRWDQVEQEMGLNWFCCSAVENVLYSYYRGEFKWYDNKVQCWRSLKGLEGLPKFVTYSRVKLADYGGNMAVLWDKYAPASGYMDKMIWCAEISLERRNSEEIWGKVKWFDAVLKVPKSYEFVHDLAATV